MAVDQISSRAESWWALSKSGNVLERWEATDGTFASRGALRGRAGRRASHSRLGSRRFRPMYTAKQYGRAIRVLGAGVTEAHRQMLAAHAAKPDRRLDVFALARAAGQVSPNFTYSQYGALGHRLARVLRHRETEHVWTRLIGDDDRDPASNAMCWTMHRGLADAVRRTEWFDSKAVNETSAATAALLPPDGPTVRDALIKARINQGAFRSRLIRYWGGCSVTGTQVLEAIVAGHIKPWRQASDRERLDVRNGLLLTGNLDRLFDTGLIAFDGDGRILMSELIPVSARLSLGLRPQMKLRRVEPGHQRYLRWHREHIFIRR